MSSNKKFWFITLSILVVVLGATLQSSHSLAIFGIRPNLVLAVLIALCFFIENLAFFCLLILLGSIGIHFEPGISTEAIMLALILLAAFLIKERMVWPGLFGTGLLLLLGTFATYALVAPSFIYQHFGIVVFESVYNKVLGLILFELTGLYVKKTRFTI